MDLVTALRAHGSAAASLLATRTLGGAARQVNAGRTGALHPLEPRECLSHIRAVLTPKSGELCSRLTSLGGRPAIGATVTFMSGHRTKLRPLTPIADPRSLQHDEP